MSNSGHTDEDALPLVGMKVLVVEDEFLIAQEISLTLKQAGCEVEFARYPGGSHAMLRVAPPSHRADFISRLVGWFSGHLGQPA